MDLWVQILLILLVTLAGGIIQRVTGFGFGIFVMMFLPAIVGGIYGSASLLATACSMCMTATVAIKYRKHVKWKVMLPCLVGSCITTALAVAYMKGAANEILQLILGVVLITLSVYFMFCAKNIKIKPSVTAGAILGALSGILSGLFSMGGPPVVLYYLSTCEEKDDYTATIQCFFAFTGVYGIITKTVAGFLVPDLYTLIPMGITGILLGSFIGERISDKINVDTLRKLVYLVMAVRGVVSFVTALTKII